MVKIKEYHLKNLLEKHNYKSLTNQKKIKLLGQFADDLDSLISYGFVHGDINSSNVFYDGVRLNLIDLEPSFKQIKYGKVFMSAVPLRSLNDGYFINLRIIMNYDDKLSNLVYNYLI